MDASALTAAIDSGISGAVDRYWLCEFDYSYAIGASFSSLIDYSCDDDRRCAMCGGIIDTNEFGVISHCTNKKCEALIDFWDLQGFPKPTNFCQKKSHKNRQQFLRARIIKMFGSSKLFSINNKLMFDFLLCSMIERIAHEANN